jgi:nitrite reductase/ring-hydroxylating ferredoxin subunit
LWRDAAAAQIRQLIFLIESDINRTDDCAPAKTPIRMSSSQHKLDWVRIASIDDIAPGRAKYVALGDLELAVFHLTLPDRFVVVKNSCPHAGGNLSAGRVEGNVVTCPWHDWAFDLDTGMCTLSDAARLNQIESRVESDRIEIRLPAS